MSDCDSVQVSSLQDEILRLERALEEQESAKDALEREKNEMGQNKERMEGALKR